MNKLAVAGGLASGVTKTYPPPASSRQERLQLFPRAETRLLDTEPKELFDSVTTSWTYHDLVHSFRKIRTK